MRSSQHAAHMRWIPGDAPVRQHFQVQSCRTVCNRHQMPHRQNPGVLSTRWQSPMQNLKAFAAHALQQTSQVQRLSSVTFLSCLVVTASLHERMYNFVQAKYCSGQDFGQQIGGETVSVWWVSWQCQVVRLEAMTGLRRPDCPAWIQ